MKKNDIFKVLTFIIVISISFVIIYNKIFDGITHKFEIESFSKPTADTLIPKREGTYSSHIVKISGEVSDTVKIILGGSYERKITGKVDTILKNLDYYGIEKAIFYFDPYKAKNGSLQIKHSIQ